MRGIIFPTGLLLLSMAGAGLAQNLPPTVPADSPQAAQVTRPATQHVTPQPPSRQPASASTQGATPQPRSTLVAADANQRWVNQPTAQHAPVQAPVAAELSYEERLRAIIKPPPAVLRVKSGVNVIFGVAENDLNRLTTPFRAPVVKTTSTAVISTNDNVIYVAPQGSKPIGFFIHENGDQTNAISVTMVPKSDISPVSVNLELIGYTPAVKDSVVTLGGDANIARAWESEQPFTEAIKTLFRSLATGTVPDGFGLSKVNGATPLMPGCAISGVRIIPKQVLKGYSMHAVVALVTNVSTVTVPIVETACKGRAVLAVAAWPRTELRPGESTELYVAVRAPDPNAPEKLRPSLLGKAVP